MRCAWVMAATLRSRRTALIREIPKPEHAAARVESAQRDRAQPAVERAGAAIAPEAGPDLIIVSARTADYYDELSEIAPTIDLTVDNLRFFAGGARTMEAATRAHRSKPGSGAASL